MTFAQQREYVYEIRNTIYEIFYLYQKTLKIIWHSNMIQIYQTINNLHIHMDTHDENVKQLQLIYFKDISPLFPICIELGYDDCYNELTRAYYEMFEEEEFLHKIYMDTTYDDLKMMMLPPCASVFAFNIKIRRLLNKVDLVKKLIKGKSCNNTKRVRENSDEIHVKKARI